MATISIEQDVVEIRDAAKVKEIKKAISSGKRSFTYIKPSVGQLTKEQKDFMEKWFCPSKK